MGFFNRFKKKAERTASAPADINKENRYGCFDKMDYHYETALNKYLKSNSRKATDLTDEDECEIQRHASNHIGFFLTWIIKHHFETEIHEAETLEAVRDEKLLGVDFFLECCDGKFWGEDLSDEIFPFVNAYYDNYLTEYVQWVTAELSKRPLEFVGTWEEYHRFEHVLDEAYERYKRVR